MRQETLFPTPRVKVYQLKSSIRTPALAFAGIAALGSLMMPFAGTLTTLDTMIGMAMFLAFGAFLAYYINYTQLLISTKGIEYRQIEYSIRTTWDNVERIGPVVSSVGLGITEGLILHKPAVQARWILKWYANIASRHIPLASFASDWRDTEIGHDIKRYAPHLFTQEED